MSWRDQLTEEERAGGVVGLPGGLGLQRSPGWAHTGEKDEHPADTQTVDSSVGFTAGKMLYQR